MNMILTLSNEKQLDKIDSKDWLGNLMTASIIHFNLMGFQLIKEIPILSKICKHCLDSTWLKEIMDLKYDKNDCFKESY